MNFFHQAAAAVVLVTLSLSIQCGGMAALIEWSVAYFSHDMRRRGPVRSAALIVRFTTMMIWLHLAQILLWSGFYRWTCFPTWDSAFYFSTTSYSTVGYGDLVLPRVWRNLGPIESMTGVLMCGLSVCFLFAIVTRLVDREVRLSPEIAELRPENPEPVGDGRAKTTLHRA